MKKEFQLNFNGYWNEPHFDLIPNESGIYCVYICTTNWNTQHTIYEQLIYIGEAEDIRERIKNHEKADEWHNLCDKDQHLRFSFARISNENTRKKLEAALIFEHQPITNDQHTKSFDYADTIIKLKGDICYLTPSFEVKQGSQNTD